MLTISVDEIQNYVSLSRQAIYNGLNNGQIPAVRVGKRWIVPRERFFAWLGIADPEAAA